jgi:hypothetical protein
MIAGEEFRRLRGHNWRGKMKLIIPVFNKWAREESNYRALPVFAVAVIASRGSETTAT